MENNSNVNIFLRVRPPQLWEMGSPIKTFIDFNQSTEKMFILENTPYTFDKIFYDNKSNRNIFNNIEPNVNQLMNGYNSCILAYGQSGTGKTYTMGLNVKNVGFISLCLDSLFQQIRNEQLISNKTEEYSVHVSYIEIYNEKVFDLCNEKSSDSIHTKGTKFAGSTRVLIQSSDEATDLLLKGNKVRHTRSTLLNANSSRSHAMFTILLKVKSENSERESVLHLVDLAGSEGIRRTNHTGVAQQEGVFINQGLLTVGKVIHALSNGKTYVPYRDSVLTTVLLDCLNLDSYFTLIACISPARKNRSETLSTIRFAQSCKNLENKMLPEMNAYLKEQQRIKAKTPLKPYMIAKSITAKTPASIGHSSIKKPATVGKQFHSFITPSAKKVNVNKPRYTDLRDVSNISHMNYLQLPKESVDNNTFNIMNMSSSTEVEGPATSISQVNPNVTSFQAMPSFSPLMRRIEETIEEKMAAFMNSLRNQTTLDLVDTTILRQDFRYAVKSGIEEARKSIKSEASVVNDNSILETTSFPVSSTVQRTSQNQNSTEEIDQHKRRTNRRLMTIDLSEDTPQKSQEKTVIKLRESRVASFTAEKTVVHARRSIRIFEKKKMNIAAKVESKMPPKIKRHLTTDKIAAEYYENSKRITKKDHKSRIMDLINTGSAKELQFLPTVGSKKAHQIVTYRALKGKFNTLDDVKNGLDIKTKAWENFLKQNFLD